MNVVGTLRQQAAELRQIGAQVRRLAARLAGLRDVAWHSPAAGRFQAMAGDRSAALAQIAGRLDDVADLVDRLAELVAATRARSP